LVIFLGGSLPIKELYPEVKDRLDTVMELGINVVIGDAPGADLLMQTYLHSKGYRKVTVYAMGNRVRNNIGDWEVCYIEANPRLPKRDYYVAKDIAMTKAAKYGLMIWDRVSRGTQANILRLIEQKKKVLVCTSRGIVAIKSVEELEKI